MKTQKILLTTEDYRYMVADLHFEECEKCRGCGLLADDSTCADCGGAGTVPVWEMAE